MASPSTSDAPASVLPPPPPASPEPIPSQPISELIAHSEHLLPMRRGQASVHFSRASPPAVDSPAASLCLPQSASLQPGPALDFAPRPGLSSVALSPQAEGDVAAGEGPVHEDNASKAEKRDGPPPPIMAGSAFLPSFGMDDC